MDKGVFTKDIEAFDVTFQNLIQYLHISRARFLWNPFTPGLHKPPVCLFVIDLLITGKEFGKTTHIEDALGIILSEQWVDASSSHFCLSSQQGQVAKGFDHLDPMMMLCHTRAKDDCSALGRLIEI